MRFWKAYILHNFFDKNQRQQCVRKIYCREKQKGALNALLLYSLLKNKEVTEL